jgi:multiple sugar transport system ATP-binding protein
VAAIRLEHITKLFPGGTRALDDVQLEMVDGELTVLVGPSGCGKTTLLRLIAGLEEVTRGKIHIGDRVVNEIPPKDRDIAMVFQNYALYPHMSVYENVAFSLRERRVKRSEVDRRVREVAKILDLEELLQRKPGQLSGGQQQRVAMGRAMVRSPAAFLMDEPLSNLDAKLRVQMRGEIATLQRDLGSTMVYVTHDQTEAMTMGDRVAVLRHGRVQQVDRPQNLYDRPANLFVAGFIGSPAMNLVQAEVVDRGGELHVEFGGFLLSVDDRVDAGFRRYLGKRVALGIRPEAMEDVEFASSAPEDKTVRVQVALREALGHEVLLHFNLPAAPVLTEQTRDLAEDAGQELVDQLVEEAAEKVSRLVARVDPRTRAVEGGRVRLVIDTQRLHFFDLDSGLAVPTTPAVSIRVA